MSEDNQNQEQADSEITIRATPENSKRIKDAFADAKTVQEANRTLLQQKEELTQKVEKYEKLIEDATKEAREKKIIERFYPQPAPVGGDTAPLNPTDNHTLQLENDDSVPLSWQTFDSEADFYQKLADKKRKDPQNKELREIEAQIAKKMGHNWEIEFSGESSKVLYKSPKPITDDLPEDEKRRRKMFNKSLAEKKAQWRVL